MKIPQNHRRIKSRVLICKECGKEFNPYNTIQKFCSQACVLSFRHKTQKNCEKLQVCKQCGKEYKAWNYRSKYCSKECAYKDRATLKPMLCPVCNLEFSPERHNRKYCSSQCSQLAQTGGKPQVAFPKKSAKGRRVYLDNLWSAAVKQQAGNKCEYCGKTEGLNSHHIFSRSNYALRWDILNGVCLCAGHHVLCTFSAHKAPLEFAEWLKSYRGSDWYEQLLHRAKTEVYDKENQDKVLEELKSLKGKGL